MYTRVQLFTLYAQRSYASDYVGLSILITGYILVRIHGKTPLFARTRRLRIEVRVDSVSC